jgi:hypothetical protein
MATISYNDLLKRDNIKKFVDRVSSNGSFKQRSEDGATLNCTGNVRSVIRGQKELFELTEDQLRDFISNKSSSDAIEVEVTSGSSKTYQRVSTFYKDSDFGGVAGKSSGGGSERQELGLISLLNEASLRGDKYYVKSLGKNLKIKEASKNEGLSAVKQEPYIDVFIETQNGKRLGISCKGESAPSLAGGGLVGMQVVVPDLLNKLYSAIIKYLKKQGLKEGDIVDADSIPDLFIKIPDSYVKKILVGNKKMGGPVDLMYIGPMDVKGVINNNSGEIIINGNRGKFYTISEYMNKIPNFFFRVRKRDLPSDGKIQITYTVKNKSGFPLIFMTPKSKKNNFRLVVTDKATSTGQKLSI